MAISRSESCSANAGDGAESASVGGDGRGGSVKKLELPCKDPVRDTFN